MDAFVSFKAPFSIRSYYHQGQLSTPLVTVNVRALFEYTLRQDKGKNEFTRAHLDTFFSDCSALERELAIMELLEFGFLEHSEGVYSRTVHGEKAMLREKKRSYIRYILDAA